MTVPEGTKVLLAELDGVGREYPLSIEKLCPVLSFYVVRDWQEGCERCKQILRYGGMGHTMGIHSQNEQVILEFGLKKPAFRIVVNSPTTHGSIGLTTGLDPAMTLGCGGYGGNITSTSSASWTSLGAFSTTFTADGKAHPVPAITAPKREGEVMEWKLRKAENRDRRVCGQRRRISMPGLSRRRRRGRLDG